MVVQGQQVWLPAEHRQPRLQTQPALLHKQLIMFLLEVIVVEAIIAYGRGLTSSPLLVDFFLFHYVEDFVQATTNFPPACWTRNNTTFLIGSLVNGYAGPSWVLLSLIFTMLLLGRY